jgi:predicted glutamine amidotransferase
MNNQTYQLFYVILLLIQICGVPGNALQSATKPRERGGGMASKLGHCGDGWLGIGFYENTSIYKFPNHQPSLPQ